MQALRRSIELPFAVRVERFYWSYDAPDVVLAKAAGAPKGEKAGHKYIKRVPTGNPKHPWRYVYSEASLAHQVKEGDRVNLGAGGHLDINKITWGKVPIIQAIDADGKARVFTAKTFADELYKHYGERMSAAAEKVAQRWGRSEARIADIHAKGLDTPGVAGDFAKEIGRRVTKLRKQGMIDKHWALGLTQFIAGRADWGSAAQMEVLSLINEKADPTQLAHVCGNLRTVMRAAENLRTAAGASQVGKDHVKQAFGLRWPGAEFTEADFSGHISKLRAKVDIDNAKLETAMGILQGAVDTAPEAARAVSGFVQGLSTQDSGMELRSLSKAFPGLRNDEGLARHRDLSYQIGALLEQAHGAHDVKGTHGPDGANCDFFMANADGQAQAHPARYKLMEADDVIASHKAGPARLFPKNAAYPENVQERLYHADENDAGKIHRNADKFRPEFVHNTNPDPVNGPPVLTGDGIVLGGNSRVITQQLLYQTGRGDRVKAHLTDHAHEFGLTPESVAGMKQPILVRSLEGMQAKGRSEGEMRELVRRCNENFTNALDPRSLQVSLANRISESNLADLAHPDAGMRPDETLNDFLTSGRSSTFIKGLEASGIFDNRNKSQYFHKTRGLNEDGKQLIARLLVGKMLPDAEVLSELPVSTTNALAKAAPHILAAAGHGAGHDLRADLKIAARTLMAVRSSEHTSLERYLAAPPLPGVIEDDPIRHNERALKLYEILTEHGGERLMPRVFRAYSDLASKNREDEQDIFGGPPRSPTDLLGDAVRLHGKGAKAHAEEDAPKEKKAPEGQGSLLAASLTGGRFFVTQQRRDLGGFGRLGTLVKAWGQP